MAEDFEHIEHDFIPEGLEFQEEFMDTAFEMYDEEIEKRKKRGFILFFFVGLSMLLTLFTVFPLPQLTAAKSSFVQTENNPRIQSHEVHEQAEKTEVASLQETKIVSEKELSPINTSNSSASKTLENSAKQPMKSASISLPNENTGKGQKTLKAEKNRNGKKNLPSQGELIGSVIPNENTSALSGLGEGSNTVPNTTKPALNQLTDGGEESTKKDFAVTLESKKSESENNTVVKEETTSETNEDKERESNLSKNSMDSATIATSSTSTPLLSPENLVKPDFRRNQFYFTACINTLFDYATEKSSFRLKEAFGLGYIRNFTPKLALDLYGEMFTINNLKTSIQVEDQVVNTKNIRYNFISSLYYIAVTPKLTFKVFPKHQLSFGSGIEFLHNEFKIGEGTKASASIDQFKQNKIIFDYYKKVNLNFSFGYGYSFNSHSSINIFYNYGLTDISLSANSFDRNNRLLLNYKYIFR